MSRGKIDGFLLLLDLFKFNSLAAASVSDLVLVSAASTTEAVALLGVSSVGASFSEALFGLSVVLALEELVELAHVESFFDGEAFNFTKSNVLGL